MKKILASILAITMLMTTLSACVIPASANDAVATGAFTEDFENYGTLKNGKLTLTGGLQDGSALIFEKE